MPSTQLSRVEFTVLGELAKAHRQSMMNMFNGTKLRFGTISVLSSGKSLLSSGSSLKSGISKLAKGGSTESKVGSVSGMNEAFQVERLCL
jgi:hypothetical protein